MTKRYLIDTDILIDLIKDRYRLKEKIKSVQLVNCFVSEITLAELHFGAFYSSSLERHKDEASDISKSFNIIPISEVLALFGQEKARLVKGGKMISDFDLLIAVTAIKYKFTLVTANEKHHNRVEGIEIENWRNPIFNEFLRKE